MTYAAMLAQLRRLPWDRRLELVVRSMPFGDIIENDTRKLHIERQDQPEWKDTAYRLCGDAKSYDASRIWRTNRSR